MTRGEAEKLVLDAEGRLCVQFFRRADGSVLTADCPVGLAALRRRVARTASAVASIVFGFVGGLFGIRAAEGALSILPVGDVPVVPINSYLESTDLEIVVGQADFDEGYRLERGEMVMGSPVIESLPKRNIFIRRGRSADSHKTYRITRLGVAK